MSALSPLDIYHFREGTWFRAWERLGAHLATRDDVAGVQFAVWAPNAASVSLIGDFNGWNRDTHPMTARADDSGLWELFVPALSQGAVYKYFIRSRVSGHEVEKSDPYALRCEQPPRTAAQVWDTWYEWHDHAWQERRKSTCALDAPWSIYEVHLGSWRRVPEDGNRSLSYREIAHQLADYVCHMGFTHVEIMPVMEHPFYGSWGYQVTGYFAPSARYGTPQDFMYLVEHLHQRGIGVILDWVPSHFPTDEHGLSYFDGTHLYEHADPRQGFHPEWGSAIFNYGRAEVRNFLGSNALFWLDIYRADALRVDAVASMLYLDYGRRQGEWIPNTAGGNENLEARDFLRQLNEAVYRDQPAAQTIAEESTAWPMVSRPTYLGGLGFGLKWNMGWMNDTLRYFQRDPIHRRHHHDTLTFSIWYAFTENFVLPLSHDEVVHGKGSLLGKMPGDDWQQFANLRLLYGYMWGHPGKKLLFMGGELGQRQEWQHDGSLEWHVLQHAQHAGIQRWVHDLNHFYRRTPALFQLDFSHDGFEWVESGDAATSVIAFLRRDRAGHCVLVVCNFTPVIRHDYRVGVPTGGHWRECLNSDAAIYGGSDQGNHGGAHAQPRATGEHGLPWRLALTLPPLGVLIMAPA